MGEGNGQIWIWSQKRMRRKTNKTRSGGNKDGLPTSNKGETGDTRRNMEHRGRNETADEGYARGGRTNDTAARKDQKEMDHTGNPETGRRKKRTEEEKRHLGRCRKNIQNKEQRGTKSSKKG